MDLLFQLSEIDRKEWGMEASLAPQKKSARGYMATERRLRAIRHTAEGWLKLAVLIDLCSRRAIEWSIKSRLACELAMDALPMAIWRRRATSEVVIRCDQSMQYGSDGWRLCRGEHGLGVSMSRRSNY
ncbi:DDE-type integrase/transposase/recombinase [Pseudoxanthomonas mexicana]|uniref:DDE-type integrase/transposase/recombinase n=1 Tax=Pseudoxanthomonas mexicana TaxID=128785 RepID=UPI000DB7CDA0|nr:DDE-type integrase/transposase/recombinase [Pseudoxanthomonas mexicana]PZQ32609.1 MAG: hypothetical protein DI562_03205 [Stenotrophomonas acidaminiphila]